MTSCAVNMGLDRAGIAVPFENEILNERKDLRSFRLFRVLLSQFLLEGFQLGLYLVGRIKLQGGLY